MKGRELQLYCDLYGLSKFNKCPLNRKCGSS